MGALPLSDPRLGGANLRKNDQQQQHEVVVEEIEGIIKLYKDGHVQRYPIVPHVTCSSRLADPSVVSGDVMVDSLNGVWARFYVPQRQTKLPLLVYFHGGGFCVGSAAWKCYHEFLSKLASAADCVVMSVNYRLAPENRLPAAFEDGIGAVKWVRQQTLTHSKDQSWWRTRCNFSKVFVAGDSAGGCLAHNVACRLSKSSSPNAISPLCLKGMVLIQPFFGGEERTWSERNMVQPGISSALSLRASDAYWRLALPVGATRDHLWCNPLSKEATKQLENLSLPPALVCISDLDILKDRNLDFCAAMKRAGKNVEHVVYVGVGHAFQILHRASTSQTRSQEMVSHIKTFINK